MEKKYHLFYKSCEDMSEVPPHSIDSIIVDPPFNVSSIYGGIKDTRPTNEHVILMESVAKEVQRVCSEYGKVFVMAADTVFSQGSYITFARQLQDIYLEAGFYLHERHLVIIKDNDGVELPECADEWRDYQAIGDAHSSTCHLLVFGLKEDYFRDGSILYPSYCPADEHPCPFPPSLVQFMLRYVKYENMNLLEPFMGTGRLGQEVIRRGGEYWGYEVNEKIFRKTEEQFEKLLA